MVSATTIAQAIPIVVAPLLTRIYSPEEFGLFAIYIAITTIIGVFATGRYALAIMLPKEDASAANLMWLSIIIALTVALITLIVVHFGANVLGSMAGLDELGEVIYLIPVSVFLLGLFQALNFWNNRRKEFRRLAFFRVTQGVSIGALQLLIGFLFYSSSGLIVGFVIGQALAMVALFAIVWSRDRVVSVNINSQAMFSSALVYKKFPLFSTWGALFDSLAIQMPIFVLTRFFSTAVSGMFSLTFRILNLPISLIAGSLSQVLFQKIVEIREKNPTYLNAYILRIFFYLLVATLPFTAVVFFWGEELFSLVFGSQWDLAGRIAEWMVFAVAIRLCVSPLSTVLALDHNVKLGFMWQAIYFVTTTATLLFCTRYSLETLIKIFVVHEIIQYSFYFYLILIGSKRNA